MTSSGQGVTIVSIVGREVLDSRGNPTVEAEVRLSDGATAHATVPSGASTGAYEAVELRDNEPVRYLGRGVQQAVNNINNVISQSLLGESGPSPFDQTAVDRMLVGLDQTPNKGGLGANAILAVSLAVAHAAARSRNVSLWSYLSGNGDVSLPVPII